MKQTSFSTKDIVLIAIFSALAIIFKFAGDFIPFLDMPNGGSIEIELMIILFSSFYLGYKKGSIVAIIFWILAFIFQKASWFINVPQYLLDYIIPYLSMGCATVACIKFIKNDWLRYDVAIFIAFAVKWLCNVLSGVYYYFPDGEVAGSVGSWVYSVGYNTPYNVVSLIICLICVPLIMKRIGSRLH